MALVDVLNDVTPEFLERLRRSDALGEDDFSEAVARYLFVRDVAAAASTTDPEYFRPDNLNAMESFLVEIRDNIAPQIEAFNWRDAEAANTRTAIIQRANEMRDHARDQIAPYVQHGEIDSAKVAADAARLSGNLADSERILTTLRQAAGEAGASKLSGFFEKETTRYTKQSYWLLAGLVVAVGALVFFGYKLFFGSWAIEDTASSADDWQELVKDLTARVFFLGIAAWALAFLARTYRVTRHLETVNAQKRAALDTYPLFLEALETPEQTNIVTAELAHAVLQGADSGFISADRERTVVESSPVSLLASRGTAPPPS